MTPRQIGWDKIRLKADNMRITKRNKKENNYCQIMFKKIGWRFLRVKHQKVIYKKIRQNKKNTDEYALLKRFHYDLWLQDYMYDFMYVYSETMSVGDYFSATKIFVDNYRKISTPGPVPKHCLGFSCIRSEYFEFDVKILWNRIEKQSYRALKD